MKRVAHPEPVGAKSLKKSLLLICLACGGEVKEHILANREGEVVWPPTPAQVAKVPPRGRRKRIRRKPVEAEPVGYLVHLPNR